MRSGNKLLLASLLVVAAACAPTRQDCTGLLPVVDGPVAVTTTPIGTTGCSCVTEEVLVTVEARRHYLSWARGPLWIDGQAVAPEEFTARLNEAKARHRAQHAAAVIEERTRPIRKAARDVGNTIRRLFQ